MAITTYDELDAALRKTSQKITWQKLSASSQATGSPTSLWRNGLIPAAGAIPTSGAICDAALLGGFVFDADLAGKSRYLAAANSLVATIGTGIMLYDRLVHSGGLSGTVTTTQTVTGVDLNTAASNMTERRGKSDYSEVAWFLEWYTTTGATPVTVDITYTSGAGVPDRFNPSVVFLPASAAAGRLYQITGIDGEPIRAVTAVKLSASTTTPGNFGVTGMRLLSVQSPVVPQTVYDHDWQGLPLVKIPAQACVFPVAWPTGTTTGIIGGMLDVVQG